MRSPHAPIPRSLLLAVALALPLCAARAVHADDEDPAKGSFTLEQATKGLSGPAIRLLLRRRRGPRPHRGQTRRRDHGQLLRRALNTGPRVQEREARFYEKSFLLLSRARERNYHFISARLILTKETPHHV